MPIQFPPIDRGPEWIWNFNVGQIEPGIIRFDGVNFAAPGAVFANQDSFAPGLPQAGASRVNMRKLGYDYENVTEASRPNPATMVGQPYWLPVNEPNRQAPAYDYTRQRISGVSRDSTGTPLGSVEIKLIRTEDTLLIGQTVSDAVTGAWTLEIWAGGPFFLVEYKTGSPDVAGTSIRTLVSEQY